MQDQDPEKVLSAQCLSLLPTFLHPLGLKQLILQTHTYVALVKQQPQEVGVRISPLLPTGKLGHQTVN